MLTLKRNLSRVLQRQTGWNHLDSKNSRTKGSNQKSGPTWTAAVSMILYRNQTLDHPQVKGQGPAVWHGRQTLWWAAKEKLHLWKITANRQALSARVPAVGLRAGF